MANKKKYLDETGLSSLWSKFKGYLPGASVNSANRLNTARNITLTGDVSGTASFDGSKDITLSCNIISTRRRR